MKITLRIWILIAFILFALISIFSIPPKFLQSGVVVKSVEQNSTIFNDGLRRGMIITAINNQQIKTIEDYADAMSIFDDLQAHKLSIQTSSEEFFNIYGPEIKDQIIVDKISKTRIKTGLDISGGARALITGLDHDLTSSEVDDLVAISQQRFNVYGLTDVRLSKVSDLSGNNFMLIEIAGSSPQDLEELITQQGVFEAKIGNETVFTGGKKDITYVGRSGPNAGIYECLEVQGGEVCNFRFVIHLTEQAARRHADITSKLETNGSHLSKPLDLYLDGVLTSSLQISSNLKGQIATKIEISGPGYGQDRKEAYDNAKAEMKKLQTILITGSLPFKLKIEKIDIVSPKLGDQFTQNLLIAGLFAVIAVSLLIFVRYKKFKISIAILAVSFSEVLIILGLASFIHWNLDLPSIAGIIAAIGTGIDSQIIILDESRVRDESIKQRVKKALFIIMTAFATTFVALIPLTGTLSFMGIGAASAGLLKGFAITTLIGISAGVFITRPAFADITRQLEGE